jgi:hypothetical protein
MLRTGTGTGRTRPLPLSLPASLVAALALALLGAASFLKGFLLTKRECDLKSAYFVSVTDIYAMISHIYAMISHMYAMICYATQHSQPPHYPHTTSPSTPRSSMKHSGAR